jgi:hypothetical protein
MTTFAVERKAQLANAFEVLGAERVAQGLKATGHGDEDSFLALAVAGEPSTFGAALRKHCRALRLKSLPTKVTRDIASAWDREEETFRRLAVEWLKNTQRGNVP